MWNNILREFEAQLGVLPNSATIKGSTLTIVFPDNVAAATNLELVTKIHAGR